MTEQILTFDTHNPGDAVVAGGDILEVVAGAPVWEAGIHGQAALRLNGGTTSNCQVRVSTGVGGTHSASLYFKANTLPSSGSVTMFQAQNTGNGNHFFARYDPTGAFIMGNGTTIVSTSAAGVIVAGAVNRLDYQYNYVVGGPSNLDWRLFTGANVEGTTPDLSGSFQVTGGQPNPVIKFLIGANSGTAGAPRDDTFDTIRTIDGLSWYAPYATPPPPPAGSADFSVISAQTAGGFTVRSKVANTTSLALKVCSDAAATQVVATVPAATPDAYGYATHTVTGLSAHTRYYAQLEDTAGGVATRLGAVLRARTAPTPGAAANFSFAMGSCMTSKQTDGSSFDDLRGWDPDFLLHAGDFHYMSSTSTVITDHIAQWETQIDQAGGIKAALANVPIYYQRSDHEAGTDNADSNQPYVTTSIEGYKVVFPTPALGDTRNPTVGTYYSFPYGRVKFILIDIRNTDRSPGADPQSSSKTMLGATQKAWLKNELSDPNYPLKIILSDVAWIGPASTTPPDKWWSYDDERTEIGNYITSNGIRAFLLHGDTHSLMADSGATNQWGGFPVVCGSPFANVGGGYNLTLEQVYNTTQSNQGRQYQRVTVTDDGSQITVHAIGWDVLSGGVNRTDLTKGYAATTGVTYTVWTGTQETAASSVKVWDGTTELAVTSSQVL